MKQTQATRHTCHRCQPHDLQGPFRPPGTGGEGPDLESIDTTFADAGDEVFFTSGYSAREIAQKHAPESGGQVYVNNISRNIKRRGMSVSVSYAVAKSPVYTLRGADAWHDQVYRAYWPAL